MLIEAVDTRDNRHEVVMKVFSSSEGSHGAAIIELVCSLIAKELGLKRKKKMFQAFRTTMADFDSSKLEVILDQVPEIWWNIFDIRYKLNEYLANIPTESSNISTLAQSHLQQ